MALNICIVELGKGGECSQLALHSLSLGSSWYGLTIHKDMGNCEFLHWSTCYQKQFPKRKLLVLGKDDDPRCHTYSAYVGVHVDSILIELEISWYMSIQDCHIDGDFLLSVIREAE